MTVSPAQSVSVLGAHGHEGAGALRLGLQRAEPRPGGPGGRQADHRGRGQAGGGKELAEELHRSEPGGIAAHGLPLAGPASSSLANPPAAPAQPAGVQPHIQLPQTLAAPRPPLAFHATDTPVVATLDTQSPHLLRDGCRPHSLIWLQHKNTFTHTLTSKAEPHKDVL